jgi:two-component system NarL family sensor kinase
LSIAIARAHLFARSAQVGAVEERNRLAREIHDTLAQGLSAISLQLETADALMEAAVTAPGSPPTAGVVRARSYVQQALTLARSSLDEARRSVLDLRAAPLEGRTLATALAELAATDPLAQTTSVTFRLTGDDRPLPVHIEVGLFRIAQEAFANITRHAEAKTALVHLSILPGEVSLVVEDDGKGFLPDQIPEGRFGLIGLTERANLLGGSLHLESCPGEGAKIVVTVPLQS